LCGNLSSFVAFTCTRNVFGSGVEKQQSVAPYQLKVMPGAGRVSAGLHAALVTQEQLLLSSKHNNKRFALYFYADKTPNYFINRHDIRASNGWRVWFVV